MRVIPDEQCKEALKAADAKGNLGKIASVTAIGEDKLRRIMTSSAPLSERNYYIFRRYLIPYRLSPMCCRGILRRAKQWGVDLPEATQRALEAGSRK